LKKFHGIRGSWGNGAFRRLQCKRSRRMVSSDLRTPRQWQFNSIPRSARNRGVCVGREMSSRN
jgi:hypothetical protein